MLAGHCMRCLTNRVEYQKRLNRRNNKLVAKEIGIRHHLNVSLSLSLYNKDRTIWASGGMGCPGRKSPRSACTDSTAARTDDRCERITICTNLNDSYNICKAFDHVALDVQNLELREAWHQPLIAPLMACIMGMLFKQTDISRSELCCRYRLDKALWHVLT